jgi:hypothetical protein
VVVNWPCSGRLKGLLPIKVTNKGSETAEFSSVFRNIKINAKIMKNVIVLFMALLMGSSLLFAQEVSNKSMMKEEKANKAYAATRALIESGQFEFIADRLISSTGYTKSIITTPNNIRIKGEQVEVHLPYFGEARANTPYMSDGGIKYKGLMEDYTVEFKDDKRRAIVRFSIDKGIEEHNFIMTIHREGNSRVTVISSGRTSISYYGDTDAMEDVSGF